jgi:hypothetical protein
VFTRVVNHWVIVQKGQRPKDSPGQDERVNPLKSGEGLLLTRRLTKKRGEKTALRQHLMPIRPIPANGVLALENQVLLTMAG